MSFLSQHNRITNPPQGSAGAYISVASAGDVFRYTPAAPVWVKRWGFLATTTVNDATNALRLTMDLRPTIGSNVSRTTGATTTVASQTGYNATGQPGFLVDTAGGSLTLTASATQLLAGKGVYHDLNPQAATGSNPALYPRPDTDFLPPGGVDTQFVVYPGQEIVIAVQATAPGSGVGILFMEMQELPNQGTGYNQLGSILPSSISPTPSNSLVNMTRTQS